MKLTVTQVHVLSYLNKQSGQAALSGSGLSSAKALLKKGFVRYYGRNYFAITPEGRQALKGGE
ncbi:MAG: hypothetical protein WBG82_04980 [Parvibaculum sp.]|uniref:hypothetical protein n=1 Tax=Parvibaculum sp. TaxID=2024848 RepID=UPI003C757FB0